MIILNLIADNIRKILSIIFMVSFSGIANKAMTEFLPNNYQGANMEKVEQIIVYAQYVFYFLAVLMTLDIIWKIYLVYKKKLPEDNSLKAE